MYLGEIHIRRACDSLKIVSSLIEMMFHELQFPLVSIFRKLIVKKVSYFHELFIKSLIPPITHLIYSYWCADDYSMFDVNIYKTNCSKYCWYCLAKNEIVAPKTCLGCSSIWYCNPRCQGKDWSRHRAYCTWTPSAPLQFL